MASGGSKSCWRPDGFLPAILIIAPYFLNKLIYSYCPPYRAFLATDYACRIVSLGFLYALLRSSAAALPIPFRLVVPSGSQLFVALAAIVVLIGSTVLGLTQIRYLNVHSGRLTGFPLPTDTALLIFDNTVGMILVGMSEETAFRFYLMNLLLLRGASSNQAVIVSTIIFAAIHWSYGAGTMLFSALAGLVLGMIFLLTRNLAVPVIAHAAYDATFFVGGIEALRRILIQA